VEKKKTNYQGQFRLLCECKIYIQTAGRRRSVILDLVTIFAFI